MVPSRRTSLVIDPPDGRIPFTTEGRSQQVRSKARYGKGPYNSWLDLDTGERCITDGLPIYFSGYNNNYQILQTPDYVVIVHELYRETRIIPLDGRPHVGIPQWLGDSRGHWDGNTLIVDTTRFADREDNEWADAWRASRRTTHLVERFTRVDAETLDYQFTWEDPTIFTRPWTAAFPLTNNQASRGVTVGRLYVTPVTKGTARCRIFWPGRALKRNRPERRSRRRHRSDGDAEVRRWPSSVRTCCCTAPSLRRCARRCATSFGFKHVDAGDGWLIFALPPAELGVHPAGPTFAPGGRHQVTFMCDDIHATVRELRAKGIASKAIRSINDSASP